MQPCCAQVRAVQAYLEHVLASTDQKLLVFAHHRDLLDGIEFAMNKCARARSPSSGCRRCPVLGGLGQHMLLSCSHAPRGVQCCNFWPV